MSEDLLLTVYERAWNARDPDACAGCFTRDGVREARQRRGAPTGVRGREAIRAEIALVMAAVPDLAIEVLAAAYASDRRLWTEWRVTGACAGEPPRPLAVLGVSVFRLSNDGFREERLYWDSAFAR